jgi:hypothetical protein
LRNIVHSVLNKNRFFFSTFYGEIIFKIITSVPGVRLCIHIVSSNKANVESERAEVGQGKPR